MKDHPFVPFPYDTSVCDECGGLGADHPSRELDGNALARRRAMWAVLLRHGGLYNFYGGPEYQVSVAPLIEHLNGCDVNWKLTQEPQVDDLEFFSGTFATSNDRTAMLHGRLYCACGKLRGESVCLNNMTMGQLIWHVVREEGVEL